LLHQTHKGGLKKSNVSNFLKLGNPLQLAVPVQKIIFYHSIVFSQNYLYFSLLKFYGMKKNILIACGLVFFQCTIYAQQADYKVVFDFTSKDSVNQQTVVRQLDLIKGANPEAKLEVVIYGQGLSLVVKDQSAQAPAIQKLLSQKDISFKVCAMTMKRNNVDKSQLLPGVEIVPDGIYEIFTKQKEGWGYIKVAH
jgi:uncharacterized protein